MRPDHIGDVLLTLPAVTALRRELPNAHLAYAAPPASSAVAERCAALDETMSVRFPPVGRGQPDRAAWDETVRKESARIAGAFDAALVVRPDDPWSGELLAAASIPIRLGFDMPRTRPYLTDALPVPSEQHVALDGFDLGAALLARLRLGGRMTRVADPSFVVLQEDEEEARDVLADVGVDGVSIVVHPGSGWPLKNWPVPRWRRLVVELARAYGEAPIVAGSPTEETLARTVADGTAAISIAGRLSLGGLAALHRRARLVVTTDSGAMHLAAVMSTPVVALFGPGDPVRFAPLAPVGRVRIVRAGLPCSPCGTLEHPPCGAAVDPECVTAIAVADVLRAVDSLLPARPGT